MALNIRPASEVAFDCISLGEIMLRLDPGEGRIHTARNFQAWEGGGEYNVTRGLRRCFNQRVATVSAFADNPVGRLVEDFILPYLHNLFNEKYLFRLHYDFDR